MGYLSVSDIVTAYSEKIWHTRVDAEGRGKPYTDKELDTLDPERLAQEIVEFMDTTGDEHITYHEFMSYHLGRQKHEVLIHLYDISKGAADNISPWLIGE